MRNPVNPDRSTHHSYDDLKTYTVTIQQQVVVKASNREEAKRIAEEHPPFRLSIKAQWTLKTISQVEVVGIREERR